MRRIAYDYQRSKNKLIGHIGVSLLSCATGELKWRGRRVDLVLSSNYQFRAVAEVYACADSQEKFVRNLVAAWTKVMELDRFDVK